MPLRCISYYMHMQIQDHQALDLSLPWQRSRNSNRSSEFKFQYSLSCLFLVLSIIIWDNKHLEPQKPGSDHAPHWFQNYLCLPLSFNSQDHLEGSHLNLPLL